MMPPLVGIAIHCAGYAFRLCGQLDLGLFLLGVSWGWGLLYMMDLTAGRRR